MNDLEPRPTMSTAEAGRIIGVSAKTIAAMYRDATCPIQGYPILTRGTKRTHAIRIYSDSVAAYQRMQERTNPLRGGWTA